MSGGRTEAEYQRSLRLLIEAAVELSEDPALAREYDLMIGRQELPWSEELNAVADDPRWQVPLMLARLLGETEDP